MPSIPEPALCEFCKLISVLATSLESVRSIPYHKTFEALKASALVGCPLCNWTVQNFPKYAISKIKNLEYIVRTGSQYFALMFMIEKKEALEIERQGVPLNSLDNLGMFFQAFYCNGRPPASNDRITGRKVLVDPVEAISAVALPWISICESAHDICQQPKQPQLPTRVLGVGDEGDEVVLIDSQGIKGRYTILSYCWGQGATLKTTPYTLAARERGIPYDDLPLTLRHAVQVTRQIGVNYLWVDALCIIQDQDPPTDWLVESGKMLDYYRNAYVTIGNLDGEASSSGFLFPREDRSVKVPGHVDIAIRTTSNRIYWSIYENSVLATRAWCLQERLVSTRLLLFGKDQMFWECRTCCEREGTVVVGDETPAYGLSFQGKRVEELEHEMISVLAGLGRDDMSLRDCMNIWYSIVEQYTSRRLTRATDLLIAISGVATEIERRTGYDYAYGLWKQDWCKGLVWNRRPGGQTTGAPSWSWASKTGLIGFKVLQTSEDSSFNTIFEDQAEFQKTSSDNRVLYIRAKCRQVDWRELLEGRTAIGETQNVHVFWDEPEGTDYVELDERYNNLPKSTYKTLNTLLRCKYTVEVGLDSNLLLSGYFIVSYLLLAPDDALNRKWKRIGLGTYERNISPTTIGFEDLGSEVVLLANQLRPELLFDDCDYEEKIDECQFPHPLEISIVLQHDEGVRNFPVAQIQGNLGSLRYVTKSLSSFMLPLAIGTT